MIMAFPLQPFFRPSEDREFILSLYNEYARLMYFTARQYTAEADTQNDIVQESLLRLIRNTSTLRGLDPPALSTYIVTTVKNVSIDALRKEKRIREHTVELDDESVRELASPEPAPDELMAALEDRGRLTAALASLPEDERLLLEQKYFLGSSDRELARSFRCKPGSIRMKLTRARRHMLSILREDRGDESDDEA